tara:strand:+ start:73 stop:588 length:516 start_codon:yes stop_codon:yes gene_type:complete
MKTLRWKPLRSSVKQARSLTGILEGINLFVSALIVLLGVFGLSIGQFVPGLVCILLGVVTYLLFKMAYIALELLTEIADDTRLQLMALAGHEYDQMQVEQDEAPVISVAPDDPTQVAEIYNAAVKGYRKYGRKVCSFDDSTVVSTDEVVLRDSDGKTIMTMVLYEGEWIRE